MTGMISKQAAIEAVESEYLIDDTGNEEDLAYMGALECAIAAINAIPDAPMGDVGELASELSGMKWQVMDEMRGLIETDLPQRCSNRPSRHAGRDCRTAGEAYQPVVRWDGVTRRKGPIWLWPPAGLCLAKHPPTTSNMPVLALML